jgi:hypothetical protein
MGCARQAFQAQQSLLCTEAPGTIFIVTNLENGKKATFASKAYHGICPIMPAWTARMTYVVWMALSAVGIAVVYRTGLRIERWSPTVGIVYLVLLAPAAMIGSWVAAHQIVGADQATCEEMDPSADRLSGMSPSEFRSRCIATQDNSRWIAFR